MKQIKKFDVEDSETTINEFLKQHPEAKLINSFPLIYEYDNALNVSPLLYTLRGCPENFRLIPEWPDDENPNYEQLRDEAVEKILELQSGLILVYSNYWVIFESNEKFFVIKGDGVYSHKGEYLFDLDEIESDSIGTYNWSIWKNPFPGFQEFLEEYSEMVIDYMPKLYKERTEAIQQTNTAILGLGETIGSCINNAAHNISFNLGSISNSLDNSLAHQKVRTKLGL